MEDRDTIAYGFVEDVFVLVHRTDHIDDRDWQICMSEARRSKNLECMLLVPGKVLPDVGLRYDIVELYEKQNMRMALLSDLPQTDRVVTALKWGGIEVEGFAVEDLDGMLAFLARPHIRARISSVLGPYLERSWLQDITSYTGPSSHPLEANQ